MADFSDYENMLVGGHVITQNTMRNAGRHFFNFHGNGTSMASRNRGPMDYMATLFAHNHIYNGMLQTRDAGLITGFYSSGGTLYGAKSQVVYNVLHDSYDRRRFAHSGPSCTTSTAIPGFASIRFRWARASVLTLRGYPDGQFSCAEAGMERAVSFRVGLEADAWVCEWRIPFAACGSTPRETPQLAFNLAVRHREHDT